MHPTEADLSPSERRREIAAIFAGGILRLSARPETTPDPAFSGASSVSAAGDFGEVLDLAGVEQSLSVVGEGQEARDSGAATPGPAVPSPGCQDTQRRRASGTTEAPMTDAIGTSQARW